MGSDQEQPIYTINTYLDDPHRYEATSNEQIVKFLRVLGLCHYSKLPMVLQAVPEWPCSLQSVDHDTGYLGDMASGSFCLSLSLILHSWQV